MKITKEIIESFEPSKSCYDWYLNNSSNDLKETLLNVSKVNFNWATWLIARLMNKKQNLELAIFAAEKVLYIYEAKYNDYTPRNAILAAKKVLENDNEENRELAKEAANAAYRAAHASYYAVNNAVYASAYAVYSAASAAYSAASAAYYNPAANAYYYATDDALDAANAAYAYYYTTDAANPANSSKKAELQIEIIDKAMEILERK